MARTWTTSQQAAMDIRGKLLLVSAAAGSGKTSVLTERIIRTLTDREHPADLSRMLVVTFTRAAAAELKSRIAAALTEALAEHPGDAHLSRQLFLLGSAQISTIDSFFQNAVRGNFEELGLPASFRIADENEINGISLEILNDVIGELYIKYEPHTQTVAGPFARLYGNRFAELMDHLLSNRHDAELDRELLDYRQGFASYPEGIGLLRQNAEHLRASADREFFESDPGRVIQKHLCEAFDYYIAELLPIADYLETDERSAAYFSGVLAADLGFCREMAAALAAGCYNECRRILYTYQRITFPTMRGKPPEMERYKNLRADLKSAVESFREELFAWSPEELRDQLLQTADLCEMLYMIFSEYGERILAEKKSRGILEFDDVREQLYRLLTLPDGSPSPFAASLAEQYDAVYIDEYQDVDFLQDRIFAIIGGNRRFMVGDIKQSIYGFRGSEPSIFADYRRSMPLHTDKEAEASPAVCVFMSENFRCNRPVIDYANRVCSFLFSACEESVGYRPQDDLVCSKYPPPPEDKPSPAVQTLVFEPYPRRKKGDPPAPAEEERPVREAVWTAAEISRLLREERLDSGAAITPADIAVLVRNAAHGKAFARELEKLGIPVTAPGTQDLLHAPLMTDTLNLLRAIDNPYRDLPLSEYLLTESGGFALEELTAIRSATPDRKSLYDAMTAAAEDPTAPYHGKAAAFVDWLELQRRTASVQPADRFLRLLYLDPRLSERAREPELLLLYEQARIYQRSSWCGLYGFLEHFSKLLAGKPLSAGGFQKAESAVSIMTVHHSKGLEFPVVFLAATGSRFNTDSQKEKLLFHRKVGCAGKLYDPALRENTNTVLREAIKLEIADDEIEEAIRTLYVALTRARERMYVTGTSEGSVQNAIANAATLKRGSRYSILRSSSNLKWILAALQQEGDPLPLRTVGIDEELEGIPYRPLSEAVAEQAPTAAPSAETDELQAILERQRSFVYPLSDLHGIPTKVAASKLRPDLLDHLSEDEEGQATALQIELMQGAAPAFESLLQKNKQPSAAEIGTATHAFLQFCDFDALQTAGIEAETERLVRDGFLSKETAALIRQDLLEGFLQSDLMQQIRSAKHIRREQQFNLLLPLTVLTDSPQSYAALEGQTVFVQGSIDLILETADGRLLLFDYKTDRITEEERSDPAKLKTSLAKRHGDQLAIYCRAVRDLFGRQPDAVGIYSLPLGACVYPDIQSNPFL